MLFKTKINFDVLLWICRQLQGATENARPENAGLENDGQHFSKLLAKLRGLEDAGLENDGQNFSQLWAKLGVWKMQDWKMTDHVN